MKVAFSGSSGSGKTTLVEYVAKELGLRHISGSAGHIKTIGDVRELERLLGHKEDGHEGVIISSAKHPLYGVHNQEILQKRREEIIMENTNFVTDRSPADNLTYYVNQVGFHRGVTDDMVERFMKKCLRAWNQLDYVIFIKAVQPHFVEDNGSRIANRYYQKSIDAQFEYWIKEFFIKESDKGPQVLIIDYWDLEKRKKDVLEFLTHTDVAVC